MHKRIKIAWLLLWIYIPMLITVTLHHHDEVQTDYALTSCQDCAHHIRHDGHIYAFQNAIHDCALCLLQNEVYLSPAIIVLTAAVVTMFVIHTETCSKCKSAMIDMRSTRAPPFLCL